MTDLQKTYLDRIGGLADAICIVAKNANAAEASCITALAQIIGENAEKMSFAEKEEKKNGGS